MAPTPFTIRPLKPAEQIVVQADEPVEDANAARNRLAEVRARVRIEQVLLLRVAALHPDVDGALAVSSAPHFRDAVVRIRALRGGSELVLAQA